MLESYSTIINEPVSTTALRSAKLERTFIKVDSNYALWTEITFLSDSDKLNVRVLFREHAVVCWHSIPDLCALIRGLPRIKCNLDAEDVVFSLIGGLGGPCESAHDNERGEFVRTDFFKASRMNASKALTSISSLTCPSDLFKGQNRRDHMM